MPDRMPIGTDIDLLCYAVEVTATRGYATKNLIQRRVRVGFAKAGRLMDLLGEYGIIGPQLSGGVKHPALVGIATLRAKIAELRELAEQEASRA